MAASTSRQPHQIPIPISPSKNVKAGKSKVSRKGKGKENLVGEVQVKQGPGERNDLSCSEIDSDSSWDWAYLTDPSASKVPPIFTKDGRCDGLASIN